MLFRSPSESTSQRHPTQGRRRVFLSGVTVFAGVATLAFVLYLDRDNHLSVWMASLGPVGVVMAVILMALVCLTPFPGEFLLLMDMRIYGVWSGIGIGWVGSIVGSLAAFVIARKIGRVLVGRFVSPEHLKAVEAWVDKSRMAGLLAVRLMPFPASAVNYTLGMMRTVSLWNYLWTAAVTAIPYYASTGLLYVGVFRRWTVWSIVGVLAIAAAWIVGTVGKQTWQEFRARTRNS